MSQTERQIPDGIPILVLMGIDGILSAPALSNRVQHVVFEAFQLRVPLDDMLPAFIGQRNPIGPTIRNLLQWLFSSGMFRKYEIT